MSKFRDVFIVFLCVVPFAAAADVTVQSLRQWRAPDHTRLVFDLSAPLEHRIFTLTDPDRVVIDLEHAKFAGSMPEIDTTGPLLAAMRSGRSDDERLRIVLDLKAAAQPRSFLLGPAGDYGHRLVIDLIDERTLRAEKKTDSELPRSGSARRPAAAEPKKPFTVAIDAGHGGEDPGAIGRRYRTREKDVTLGIARHLARLVNATSGMRAVLIRDGDYYVGLRERYRRARQERADLFISIHADALPGRQASGSSVYALSEKGATDAMAKILADKENAADLVGGVSLNEMDNVLAKVLVDLSQTKTIQDSLVFGGDLLTELRRVGPVHMSSVRQAGFMVLKAPDIPSVLIETAFISNPAEERKLRTSRFQRDMAEGILRGIKHFMARTPTPALAQADETQSAAPKRARSF
jgi:N-acetylmuramoyl-L-alanine amidase